MSSRRHDRIMNDLQRLLATQDFKTMEEAQAFMNSLMNEPIPEFDSEALTDKEKAEDLAFAAFEMESKDAIDAIFMALDLDPDCIPAFEYLGQTQDSMPLAIAFFEKGVEIGRRQFDSDYRKSHPGEFWLHHETRPFMRCLSATAMLRYKLGRKQESVITFEEILRLNPNDNQGVRDLLMTILIELNETEKYKKYAKKYRVDDTTFPRYNKVLFEYKTNGPTETTLLLLKEAISYNSHVPALLLKRKPPEEAPSHYTPGDKSEAIYYVGFAHYAWHAVPGAIDWLKAGMRKTS